MIARTLEERVNTTYRRLLLIRAAVNVHEDAYIDLEELAVSINELAMEAIEDLAPLCTNVPNAIANYVPKDGAR